MPNLHDALPSPSTPACADNAPSGRSTTISLVPTSGHLYMIIVGIIAGTLLGPYVLGQLAPDFFHTYITGQAQAIHAYHASADQAATQMQQLLDTGVSAEAATEMQSQINIELQAQRAQIQVAEQERLLWLQTRVHAIWIAIALLMVIESLLGEPHPQAAARLASGRYALIAVWCAIVIARPAMLHQTPLLFVALLVGLAALLCLIPLGSKTQNRPSPS